MIKDVFAALPTPPEPKAMSARAKTSDVELAIETQSADRGLVPHKPWIDKCLQLYTVSTVCQGQSILHSLYFPSPILFVSVTKRAYLRSL